MHMIAIVQGMIHTLPKSLSIQYLSRDRGSRYQWPATARRLRLSFPSPLGATLIASTTAPRSACLSTFSSLFPLPLSFTLPFVFDFGSTGTGVGTRSSAPRTTFRPIASSNRASISSAAAFRLRFLRCLAGGDFSACSSRSSCTLLVGAVAVDGEEAAAFFNSVLLADVDEGVACWRRHSSGFR